MQCMARDGSSKANGVEDGSSGRSSHCQRRAMQPGVSNSQLIAQIITLEDGHKIRGNRLLKR